MTDLFLSVTRNRFLLYLYTGRACRIGELMQKEFCGTGFPPDPMGKDQHWCDRQGNY